MIIKNLREEPRIEYTYPRLYDGRSYYYADSDTYCCIRCTNNNICHLKIRNHSYNWHYKIHKVRFFENQNLSSLFKEPQAVVKHKALQPGCIVSRCSVTFSTLNEHMLQTFRLRTVYF